MDDEAASHVLGVQCNTWTEHLSEISRVFFMNLPRMSALAEVAWSAPESRADYQDFLSRMQAAYIPIYEAAGWNFAKFYEADLK